MKLGENMLVEALRDRVADGRAGSPYRPVYVIGNIVACWRLEMDKPAARQIRVLLHKMEAKGLVERDPIYRGKGEQHRWRLTLVGKARIEETPLWPPSAFERDSACGAAAAILKRRRAMIAHEAPPATTHHS